MRLRATKLNAIGNRRSGDAALLLALDQIGAPSAAAYSLRKLRAAYTGSAIRVRRSSDNAEVDIGFASNGDLDTTALLAHVGSGNGFVTTWYDQSGNARNATQATAGNQPRIVSNGAAITVNGVPSIDYTGITQGSLSFAGGFAIQAVSAVAKNNLANAVNYDGLLGGDPGHILNGMPGSAILARGTVTDFTAYRNGLTTSPNGNYINLSLPFIATVNYNTPATNSYYTIGLIVGGNRVWNGQISEMVSFPSVLSTTDRQTLESNEGAYYSITVS